MNVLMSKGRDLYERGVKFGLYSTVFFLPISMNITSAALFFCVLLWLLHMVHSRTFIFIRTPLDGAIIGFVAMAALSILHSPNMEFSFYNFYHLVGIYVLGYYVMVNHIRDAEQVKRLLYVLVFSAVLVAGYGFYQYIHGVDISRFDWVDDGQFPGLKMRIFSTMKNPNLLAAYLVTIIAIITGFMWGVSNFTRFSVIGVILILTMAVILTFSRSSWLSLMGVIMVLGLLKNKKLFLLFLVLPIMIACSPDIFIERMVSIVNPVDTSSTLRLALWQSTLTMIHDHPLMGIGWGAYWLVYPHYDFFVCDGVTTIYHAHNMYLNIAAEIGVPGLVFFLMMVVRYGKQLRGLYRHSQSHVTRAISLGLLAAVSGILLSGMTDYVMFSIQMGMLFWLLLSWGVVLVNYEQGNSRRIYRRF